MSDFYGRKRIITDYKYVDETNVLDFLADVNADYQHNAVQAKALFDIYTGKMDIQYKKKSTRPEINHKICENRAFQIVEFWSGTMAGDPIIYVLENKSLRDKNADAVESKQTDEFISFTNAMNISGKDFLNKSIFDWALITGQAFAFISPNTVDVPFTLEAIEPWNAFVAYNAGIEKEKVAGVIYTKYRNGDEFATVYTKNKVIYVKNGMEVVEVKTHELPEIPIIEYRLNTAGMGAFEPCIDLLNAINSFDSDRMDAVTQFVNSLVVLYNAELPDGDDTTDIRDKGIISLHSTGDVKGDIKILSQQMNQSQNQTLKNDLYNAVLQIASMPNQSDGSTSDSSNTGATFLRSGYQLTEMRAKGNETMFKKCDREVLNLALGIYKGFTGIEINPKDVSITFTRKAYTDLTSKVNALVQLLSNEYVGKLDAWQIVGLSGDPETCYANGMANHERLIERNADNNKTLQAQV